MRHCLFWLGLIVLLVPNSVDAQEFDLQPLPMNNPGLKVDLGVGLWAYPVPIDYDQDGDMDLVVSCPDKPSSGIYYFENPTQDAKNKMPVFKPAKRLGPGAHYMLLSHKQGHPVVLKPGFEYAGQSGQPIDWVKPQKLDLEFDPKAVAGSIRGNMWRYVDHDGDGDQDLAIGIGDWSDYGWDHAYDRRGKWRNGPLHGFVHLVENKGTDESPVFTATSERLMSETGPIDVYGWPCPNFADFDGDGDLDLLCGEFLDGFTIFKNTGSRNNPAYLNGQRLTDSHGNKLAMHLQMITPTTIDWDADGDIDIICGDEDGRVAFLENIGLREGLPVFEQPKYFQQEADTLKFGALVTPFACDWDGDGDEDLVCGNTAGEIGVFTNLGSAKNGLPVWSRPELLRVRTPNGETSPFRIMAGERGSIQGPCEAKWGYTTFSVADWDDDGKQDIIFNSIHGEIGLLRRISANTVVQEAWPKSRGEKPPAWDWRATPSSGRLTQWRTTPVATDFDGDGQLDLIMLDQQGFLTFRPSGGEAQRIFIDEKGKLLRLNAATCGRSGRTKLVVADWDGDSRLDVLINSENAMWLRNCGVRKGKVVLKRMGNLARRNVSGHTSSPAVCDFNNDGRHDLLVGSENGRIYFVEHSKCSTFDVTSTDVGEEGEKHVSEHGNAVIIDEFIYEKAPFPQCHASTICETSRGLVAAWFGGTREGTKDVAIWTAYHDGNRWSRPARVADGVQHGSLRYPCWNPVLFQPPGDAPTLLFFKVGPNPREWWGEMVVSFDRGRTFRNRQRLPEGIAGPIRSKPILIGQGRLLCGSSTEDNGWRVHFESEVLENGIPAGRWTRTQAINSATKFNAIQPTFLQLPGNHLRVLCRTKEGMITTSLSTDSGKTWQPMEATDLPNPNSGIEAVSLTTGDFLLVYNPTPSGKSQWGPRGTLSIAHSKDGLKWTRLLDLEQEKSAEFSYPAAIQATDGRVHITYTWKRRKIKHVVIDPVALLQGGAR